MESHAFDPHVDVVTGKISVKTLSFSSYVVASGPIPEPVKPTRPKANTTVDLPDQVAGPDQVLIRWRVEATLFKTLYIDMLCFGGVIDLASGLTPLS